MRRHELEPVMNIVFEPIPVSHVKKDAGDCLMFMLSDGAPSLSYVSHGSMGVVHLRQQKML